MKISTKSEYSLLALLFLARQDTKKVFTIQEIASAQNIPKRFLEQLLLILKRSGYVQSRKGIEGGYQLAKAPEQISLAEIIRLMDGALAPVASVSRYFYQTTPIEKEKKLLAMFQEIRDSISAKLENTFLSDLK
ncbi:MAG: Rrf2 family transcriptional regulator [Spirochaetales bacterium]|nr:Rrf2 family transcriptional regulator [Spirochaetales bacterium]